SYSSTIQQFNYSITRLSNYQIQELSTSQRSTMPTMPASTGGSAGKKGKLASLPRTKNTSSPTPAPTASTATSGRPAGCRAGVSGWTTSSLRPVRLASLRVATTSPITRASCIFVSGDLVIGQIPLLVHLHRIDDPDDG